MNRASQVREDAKKDPDILQREIDATRADVGETLDALQARLSPGQLLDQALGLLREHGGEMARNLGTSMKQNPIPMVLTGIGLAWLMSAQRSPSYYQDEEYYGSVGFVDEPTTDAESEGTGEKIKGVAAAARARMSAARERVASGAGAVSERVGHAKEEARHRAQRAREGFTHMMEEQPLVLGALGLALGAVVGAALPATRREDRLFGPARDRALRGAKEIGTEQYEAARETVKEAAAGAKRAVQERESGMRASSSATTPTATPESGYRPE